MDYAAARRQLVHLLSMENIDARTLSAIGKVPRELFVPTAEQKSAYANEPLPIGYEQTISQPLIIAIMTQSLELTGREKVLEIGTGSGYQTAILAELAREVHSTERISTLAERARQALAQLGYRKVYLHPAAETPGWEKAAPYDAIIVTAGAPDIPSELLDQLAPGGRLVIPVGGHWEQELLKITKTPAGLRRENLGGCRFVPLRGKGGWDKSPGR